MVCNQWGFQVNFWYWCYYPPLQENYWFCVGGLFLNTCFAFLRQRKCVALLGRCARNTCENRYKRSKRPRGAVPGNTGNKNIKIKYNTLKHQDKIEHLEILIQVIVFLIFSFFFCKPILIVIFNATLFFLKDIFKT